MAELDVLTLIARWTRIREQTDLPEEVRRDAADIVTALERAEEVAGQGCEFCDAMVDDLGEGRDGGREPHAHWWACGRCWNAGAHETSTIIGHLSELLDRALERVPELERRLDEAHDQSLRQAQRLERLEAAAREAAFCRHPSPVRDNRAPEGWSTANCGQCTGCKLIAALATAPAPSRPFVRTTTEVRPDHATNTYGLIQQAAAPAEPPSLEEVAVAIVENYGSAIRQLAAPAEEGDGGWRVSPWTRSTRHPAVGDETCTNCGQLAVHQAYVGTPARPRWSSYCCDCFDHAWRGQRLVPGQECQFELVEVPAPVLPPRREWRRKATADEAAGRG